MFHDQSIHSKGYDDHENDTKIQLDISRGNTALYRELTIAFRKFTAFVIPIILMYLFGKFIWALFMFYVVARVTSVPKPIVIATKPTTRLLWVPPQSLRKSTLNRMTKLHVAMTGYRNMTVPRNGQNLFGVFDISLSHSPRGSICVRK